MSHLAFTDVRKVKEAVECQNSGPIMDYGHFCFVRQGIILNVLFDLNAFFSPL